MHKFILSLYTIIFSIPLVFANNYSRNVSFISDNGSVLTLKSTASSSEKKTAVEMAIKSAFDTYLFGGIEGVNDGKPILEESHRTENHDYFNRLYNDKRYTVFLKDYKEVEKPKKNSLGLYETTVIVGIYHKSLIRDLNNSKVIKPEPVTVTEPARKTMPTIMVVPYKTEYQTYKYVLENDFDKRIAVAKVQEEFDNQSINTIDFEAKYQAIARANQMEANSSSSFDDQVIRNSGADVYVTVDINKNYGNNAPSVVLSIKAIHNATGTVLASETSKVTGYANSEFDNLCALAIQKVSKSFLDEVCTELNKIPQQGQTAAIYISIDGSSYRSLDDEVGDSGYGISDYIRKWLKTYAENGVYHIQGKTANSIIFDNIQIPTKDEDGMSQDVADFAARLRIYLRKKGINATDRIDGLSIYITISD